MLFTPGSLDSFIKGFVGKEDVGKLIFPHSKFNFERDVNKEFTKKNFPREFFWSELTQSLPKQEKYNQAFEVAAARGIKTMRDFLVLYNEQDVRPFLKGCQNFRQMTRDISINHAGTYMETYNQCLGMPTQAM